MIFGLCPLTIVFNIYLLANLKGWIDVAVLLLEVLLEKLEGSLDLTEALGPTPLAECVENACNRWSSGMSSFSLSSCLT